MTHLTLFNPSFRRLFADPFFDLPVRYAGSAGGRGSGASLWTPPVDVRESDTEVVVEAELPGIAREDISVRYHDGRLVLEGKREEAGETGPENCETACASGSWIRRERSLGRFRRSFDCRTAWTAPPSGRSPGTASSRSSAEAREGAAAPDRRQRQLSDTRGVGASRPLTCVRGSSRRQASVTPCAVRSTARADQRSAFQAGGAIGASRSTYSVVRSWPGMTRRLLTISSS